MIFGEVGQMGENRLDCTHWQNRVFHRRASTPPPLSSPMPLDRLERLQTWLLRGLLITLGLLVLVIAVGVQQGRLTGPRVSRKLGQLLALPGLDRPRVALIAGHSGFDTGAMCDDGLMEVMITEDLAARTAELLREEGVRTSVLKEYDPELEGLLVDALVSIHVDSCIPLSGFKVASAEETRIPERDAQLVACLTDRYAKATGLGLHPNTETSDMFGYHAFQRVADETPGAIIEVGFLGGDRELLQGRPEQVAEGIAQGILCFLEEARPTPTPTNNPESPVRGGLQSPR
ncbi:MAG: N-acetylmuramoyl-L-alanine amidase [Caldilineae bacterium]|nr:MAG: N-acetylmuramoyl-L-alanine amidase [Caldilineae bacterium]